MGGKLGRADPSNPTVARALAMDVRGTVHATTLAICRAQDGADRPRGVMLIGPSGSGKSTLALNLIGLGAKLIADDRTRITAGATAPIAHAPEDHPGLIEARGLGIIRVPYLDATPVDLVVDMAQTETERLPPARPVTIVGDQPVRTIWRVDASSFPCALFYLMKLGGYDRGHD